MYKEYLRSIREMACKKYTDSDCIEMSKNIRDGFISNKITKEEYDELIYWISEFRGKLIG